MAYTDSGLKQSLHPRQAGSEMNRCLQEAMIPEWMAKGKTTLIQKPLLPPKKRIVQNNYGTITCLSIMLNILTAQIREIYNSLISHELFPKEHKGCRKGTRRTGELLYIDQYILNESKTRRKKSSYDVD